jgi:rhamnosyltransferase subunit B
MMNVLLLTIGTVGDIIPFIRLGREFGARGQSVVVLTHSGYETLVRQAGLDFVPIDTPDEFQRFMDDGLLLHHPAGVLAVIQRHFLPKIQATAALLEAHNRPGATIIVAHANARLAAHFAAEKLGAPFIQLIMIPGQLANLLLLENLLHKTFGEELNRIREALGLPPIDEWDKWLRSPDLSLTVWPEWFEPAQPHWPSPVIQSGFLLGDAEGEIPEEVEAVLADDPPPVLITGGTGMFVKADYYQAALEGVRQAGRRGIVVARVQTYLPEVLPPGFVRFQSLPYAKVFPRLGALIHHGGFGTCVQALMAGVPQLIMAHGHDRPDNAARFQKLGVAEFLPPPRWQPAMVAEALNRLLHSPEVQQRCQELARRAKEADGFATACQAIERLALDRGLDQHQNPVEAEVYG